MSNASGVFTCAFVPSKSQIFMSLNGAQTDLVQRYSGSVSQPNILPDYDWSVIQPVVPIVLMSSDPSDTPAVLAPMIIDVKWFLNEQEISFNSTTGISVNSTGTLSFAGCFKKLAPDTSNNALYPFGGLQILNNLVTLLGGVNANLRCEVYIDRDNEMEVHQHSTTIGFSKAVDGNMEADIYCDPSQTFNLDATHTSVVCKSRLLEGGSVLDNTQYVMSWFVYDAASNGYVWKATAQTYTVQAKDVQSYMTVLVAYYPSGTNNGDEKDPAKAIVTDIKVVSDITDSLILIPNPVPEDGVMRAKDPTITGITFTPKVRDRETNTEKTGMKYKFTCLSPAGTILNGTPSATPGASGGFDTNSNSAADNSELLTSYTVPRAMFLAINADVTVLITAFLTN